MSSIPLNLLCPGQQFIPAAIFVTTKSVTGWQQYSDAVAVPIRIGAVSAMVGKPIAP
jgi:hypothetical protein